jgi:protein O-GlcNAc transferase
MFHENSSKALAIEYFQSGIQHYADGEYSVSKRDLTLALELNPQLILAYCYLSMIYQELEDYSLSIAICQEGLKYDPQSAYLSFCLASSFECNEQWNEALEEFNRFYMNDPTQCDVLYSMGSIYKKIGDLEKSRTMLLKYIEIDKNNATVLYLLGEIEMEDSFFQKALTYFEEVVEINPVYWRAWWKLALLYSKEHSLNKAIECYEKTVEINPELVEGFYNLGINYRLSLNPTKGAECFKKVLQLTPGDLNAKYNLGVCYLENCDYETSIHYLKEVLLEDLNNEPAHYRLGEAFLLNKQIEKYTKELRFLSSKGSEFADKLRRKYF